MNRKYYDDEQPDIEEPQIEVGQTVWSDSDGNSIGKITNITEDIVVSYPNRVSVYKRNKINVAYLPPYLVLVGSDEKVIHYY